jgi:hypothetical protein
MLLNTQLPMNWLRNALNRIFPPKPELIPQPVRVRA